MSSIAFPWNVNFSSVWKNVTARQFAEFCQHSVESHFCLADEEQFITQQAILLILQRLEQIAQVPGNHTERGDATW
ncbi:MAG: hypothetical protein CR991_00630 [Proteobacteria bacterium]|nr:MAG: hypothetical protein CR991_00630 [Pseudomonadota bacterium]